MHPLRDIWWERFINRTDGTLRRSGDGWYYSADELTKAEMQIALDQQQPLGIYAVDQHGLSRWLCLDADDQPGRKALEAIAAELNPQSSLFELSRRGAHLWWFCPPTPWNAVRAVGQSLLAQQGIICEVFPKGAGRNGVRLPFTRHPKTHEVYPVIDAQTGEIRTIQQLLNLAAEPLPQLILPQPKCERRRTFENNHHTFAELWREVERYTTLREYAPERAIGRCPFHDDRHPSLSLLGGFWRCWAGCGEGGIGAFRAQVHQRGMR